MRILLLILLLPVLSACSIDHPGLRVGVLVLLPIALVIVVLWMLLGRSGEEKWEEQHPPDDDDDDEDHRDYLM